MFIERQFKEMLERRGVAGRIGFGRDMGATKNLEKEEEAGQALEIFVACRHEITKDFKDPMRQLKFWKKVMPVSPADFSWKEEGGVDVAKSW